MDNLTPFEKWEIENRSKFIAEKIEMGVRASVKNVKPWDILNTNKEKTPSNIAEARYEICLDCPFLIKMSKQCKKCGCFMAVKTKLMEAVCPIGKW